MPWRLIREIALTAVAAIGFLCALAALAMILFGIRPVVFMSGSMGPDIPTGSLGIIDDRPATEVQIGEVVSFVGPNHVRVTHRVVEREPNGSGVVTFTTKGDANRSKDPEPITRATIDVLTWSIPGWGYLVFWLQKPPVIFAGGAVCGAWLTWWLRRPRRSANARKSDPKHTLGTDDQSAPTPHPATHRASKAGLPLALLALLPLTGWGMATGTSATFTDWAAHQSTFSSFAPSLIARTATTGETLVTNGREAAIYNENTESWSEVEAPQVIPRMLGAGNGCFYASDGLDVYKLTSGTVKWTYLHRTPKQVTSMATNYDSNGTNYLMVTDGTAWWTTNNDGLTWKLDIRYGLPKNTIDMSSSGLGRTVYTIAEAAPGSGTTVWASDDFGATWAELDESPMPNLKVIGNTTFRAIAWGKSDYPWSTWDGFSWLQVPDGPLAVVNPVDIATGDDSRYMIVDDTNKVWQIGEYLATSQDLGRPY